MNSAVHSLPPTNLSPLYVLIRSASSLAFATMMSFSGDYIYIYMEICLSHCLWCLIPKPNKCWQKNGSVKNNLEIFALSTWSCETLSLSFKNHSNAMSSTNNSHCWLRFSFRLPQQWQLCCRITRIMVIAFSFWHINTLLWGVDICSNTVNTKHVIKTPHCNKNVSMY